MAKPPKLTEEEIARHEDNQRRFLELLEKRRELDEKLKAEREQREREAG